MAQCGIGRKKLSQWVCENQWHYQATLTHPLSVTVVKEHYFFLVLPKFIQDLTMVLFVGWLLNVPATGYSVSQGPICSDNFTCCHTEIGVADQTFYLTQSQYTDTGPTSPSADPIMPGAWQGYHWSVNF